MDKLKAEQCGEDFFKLNKNHLQNLLDNGFCYVETHPGQITKVTTKDLFFDKNELEKLKDKMDKEKDD